MAKSPNSFLSAQEVSQMLDCKVSIVEELVSLGVFGDGPQRASKNAKEVSIPIENVTYILPYIREWQRTGGDKSALGVILKKLDDDIDRELLSRVLPKDGSLSGGFGSLHDKS